MALYLRLSKEDVDKFDKGDDSESITNQRLLLTDYAIEHGFQIVDVYTDDDYSGLYDDRPAFDQLIRDGKLGKFNVVLAKSQSRFTRNMEHMERYLHHDFPLLGIRFIGIVDGVDTNIKGNKKARQIYGLTNEWYCEDLSENIRSVFKQKMKAGQFLGAFAPYGYMKDPTDGHKFLIDEAAANVVKRIYDLYIQGYSIKRICHKLEDDGIPNPTVYKKQQGLTYENAKSKEFSEKYNFWSATTVTRILCNETYIGKLIQGTCEKISYKDKKVVAVPKEKWIVIDNHHEPIIESDLFHKVEALRTRRRVVSKNQTGEKKVHIFAGKIRCKTCGSTMIKSGATKRRPNDRYLRCQLANKSRLKDCTSHNILYSVVEDTVLANLQKLVNPVINNVKTKEEISCYIGQISNAKEKIKEKTIRLKELQKTVENTIKSIRLLYEDRTNGIVTNDMFLQLKEDFENENQKAKTQIKKISDELEKITQEQESKKSIDELINKYCDFSKLTHEMVADFIDYIEIGERDKKSKEQEIIIHWNL